MPAAIRRGNEFLCGEWLQCLASVLELRDASISDRHCLPETRRVFNHRANQFFKLGCHGHGGPPTWPCGFRALHAHPNVGVARYFDLLIGRDSQSPRLVFSRAICYDGGDFVHLYMYRGKSASARPGELGVLGPGSFHLDPRTPCRSYLQKGSCRRGLQRNWPKPPNGKGPLRCGRRPKTAVNFDDRNINNIQWMQSSSST